MWWKGKVWEITKTKNGAAVCPTALRKIPHKCSSFSSRIHYCLQVFLSIFYSSSRSYTSCQVMRHSSPQYQSSDRLQFKLTIKYQGPCDQYFEHLSSKGATLSQDNNEVDRYDLVSLARDWLSQRLLPRLSRNKLPVGYDLTFTWPREKYHFHGNPETWVVVVVPFKAR